MLMQPSLVLSTLVPRENLLAMLVDNSRSMSIEEEGVARGEQATGLLEEDSDFLSALADKFYLRYFRFGHQGERIEPPLEFDWSGDQTNIASGLERILTETRSLPLGGVVLFSDGSDNSYRDFKDVLAELKARKVPVHTVGLGPETLEQDVEITQVSSPRLLLPETVSLVRVAIRHYGFGGHRGKLEVREGDTLVQSQEIHFPRDSDTFSAEVKLTPRSEGVKTYRFSVAPLQGEEIAQNNERQTIIEVRNLQPRILYVEGRPRWEYKFIRQAVTDDNGLRLETLLRTALNKFYRQGIETETTLAAGFPTEREELFQYKGLVLGTVESSFFTYAQLEMIRDFVGKRGGGFLMLGGSSSFGAGQYQNTPVEEVLPVWLQAEDENTGLASLYAQGNGEISLSDYGRQHPALQLSLEDQESDHPWSELPQLTDWNYAAGTKSGSVTLASLVPEGAEPQPSPLLVFQRYGRGQALALLTGSSWRWQMLSDHTDQSHETFWRQLLRWLVASAKDPVTVETEREIYSQNESVKIRAEVNDETYNRINDAQVDASVTSPSGEVTTIPLQWQAQEDGIYQAEWVPQEDGMYEVRVNARASSEQKSYGRANSHFVTSTGYREYFEPVQKRDFLQTLSTETGGNYYTLDNVNRLPEEVVYTKLESSVVEVLELWDMPINFFLLLGFLVGEWVLRKLHGSI